MKTGTVAVILAGIVVIAGITYSFIRRKDAPIDGGPPAAARLETSSKSKIVNVDELAKSPEHFKGRIVLRAVVVGAKESEGVFGVIDSREFESCGTLNCAKGIVPVRFTGQLPKPKTVVEITGKVIRNGKGLIVQAKRVEIVK